MFVTNLYEFTDEDKFPVNTAADVGAIVTLHCQFQNGSANNIIWQFVRAGETEGNNIVFGCSPLAGYNISVDNSIRGCGLVISNIQLSYAGRYICSDFVTAARVSAELIVFGKN